MKVLKQYTTENGILKQWTISGDVRAKFHKEMAENDDNIPSLNLYTNAMYYHLPGETIWDYPSIHLSRRGNTVVTQLIYKNV